jgi:hypothetical protein
MALSLDDAEKLGGDILAGKTPPTKRTKWDDYEDQGDTVIKAAPPPAAAPVVTAPAPMSEGDPLYSRLYGETEAWRATPPDVPRIVGAMDEGWRKPDPLMTPEQEEQQTRLWGPYLGGGVNLFYRGAGALLNRVPNALIYGGAELANQVTQDPRAGRDVTALSQILPFAHIGTGVPPVLPGPRANPLMDSFTRAEAMRAEQTPRYDPTESNVARFQSQIGVRPEPPPPGPLPADTAPPGVPPGTEVPNVLRLRAAIDAAGEAPADFVPGTSRVPPGAAGPATTPYAPERPPSPPSETPPTPGQGGPRVGGAPPTGLTAQQIAEFDTLDAALPPMKGEIRTQADAEARADQIIRHFASVGNKEPIPGAEGALPTITRNSGLATLYRTARDKDVVVPYEMQETALKTAAKEKLDTMSGTEPELKAAEKNRFDTTEPMYRQAWANRTEADPSGPIKTVEDLMDSPLKQNDTAMAELRNIHKKLQGETDPKQLKGITDHIDETIARLKPEGKADRRTLAALDEVDKAITAEISRTTPGFDAAQATWANLTRRIEEMKYFQGRKMTDLQGQPTLANIRSTVDDITKRQAGDKFHPADSVTPENFETLKRLHDQAQRESFTVSGGKSLGGSNTFQNFATDSIMRQVGRQVGGNLLGTGAGYLMDTTLGGGGVTGAVAGNLAGNALAGVSTVRAAQAANRQAAGQQMLMRALRERLLNIDNKGVEALRRSP